MKVVKNLLFLAVLSLPTASYAGMIGTLVITDHTGQNFHVNAGSDTATNGTRYFAFTGFDFTLTGGQFVLNAGQQNHSQTLDVSLWEVTNTPTWLEGGTQLAPDSFNTCSGQGGWCEPTVMTLTTDWVLDPNKMYQLRLSSGADPGGNTEWIIKNGSAAFGFVNQNGDPILPVDEPASSPTPEPGTWTMICGGLGLTGVSWVRRSIKAR